MIRIQAMRIQRLYKLPEVHRKEREKARERLAKEARNPPVLFTAEQEQKIVDFLRDNEILYSKRLMDYKDRSKREAMCDKFCEEDNINNDACQRWFQSQRKLFRKVTQMKSARGNHS